MTPAERAAVYKEAVGAPLPQGINNLGNTCYMNSTIQCIGRVAELREALGNFQPANQSDTHGVFSAVLGRTYKDLEIAHEPYTPYNFLTVLRQLNPMFGETDG
jgi:ubiquitin carboxyl-terminal hydrolase 14